MKLYDGGMVVIIVIGLAALIGVLSIRYLGEDNVVEEAAEEVIKIEMEKSIELSEKEANESK